MERQSTILVQEETKVFLKMETAFALLEKLTSTVSLQLDAKANWFQRKINGASGLAAVRIPANSASTSIVAW